ncbi:MAG: phospholipase D-like domain-containing protein [bacterium]
MKHILKPGKNCWGIFRVWQTGLLVDGRHYYRAFYQAARKARRYIAMAGWQFDSDVHLLRGGDLRKADGDIRLLPFLNSLCERNPELEIYILAWDFSLLLSLKREWFQDWIFNWTATDRIHFRFDSRHAIGASHHQKFVIIDGLLTFIGGMDICSNRWDDRDHRPNNPDRINPAGKPYEAYHDIQSYHLGPVAERLAELFRLRWQHAGGGELRLPSPEKDEYLKMESDLPIAADQVAVSRTEAKLVFPMQDSIMEIRSLYREAIDAAEDLIYIENQYFSSQAVYKALIDRLRASHRSRLQVVIILPQKPHALIEEIALGLAQVKIIHSLAEVASKTGHSLGIYYPAPLSEDGRIKPVYIHAKLLLVDDRFLSVGSANISNRSMGLDTELNVSWEAASENQTDLIRSIRESRISLLLEHTGVSRLNKRLKLSHTRDVVKYLDRLARQPRYRLKRHTTRTLFEGSKWLKDLNPEDLSIDPEKPIIEETIFELISHDKSSLLSEGITWLKQLLSAGESKEAAESKITGEKGEMRPPLEKGPAQRPQPDLITHLQYKLWLWLLMISIIIALLGLIYLSDK